jgi:hypothetical protein
MLHTGREAMAARRPWPIALAAALSLAATAFRVAADWMWWRYFALLAIAAVLWLAATMAWAAFLAVLIFRPTRT